MTRITPQDSTQPVAASRATTPSHDAQPVTAWSDTLRDGSHVCVRPLRESDKDLERRFIEDLSPESRRFRFLATIGSPDAALLRQLTEGDPARDVAFVALVGTGADEREVGVSRYSVGADGVSSECAVVVSDDWHHRGVATLLMTHLIEVARQRGIASMYSIDAADNEPMRELAGFLGFERKPDPEDSRQVIHTLQLAKRVA